MKYAGLVLRFYISRTFYFYVIALEESSTSVLSSKTKLDKYIYICEIAYNAVNKIYIISIVHTRLIYNNFEQFTYF